MFKKPLVICSILATSLNADPVGLYSNLYIANSINSDWNNPGDWSPNGPPDLTDNAILQANPLGYYMVSGIIMSYPYTGQAASFGFSGAAYANTILEFGGQSTGLELALSPNGGNGLYAICNPYSGLPDYPTPGTTSYTNSFDSIEFPFYSSGSIWCGLEPADGVSQGSMNFSSCSFYPSSQQIGNTLSISFIADTPHSLNAFGECLLGCNGSNEESLENFANNLYFAGSGSLDAGDSGIFYNNSLFFQSLNCNFESSYVGYGANNIVVTGGTLSCDADTIIGPAILTLNGGAVVNNGACFLGTIGNDFPSVAGPSSFSAGTFSGNGTLSIVSDVTINIPITQSLVVVGEASLPEDYVQIIVPFYVNGFQLNYAANVYLNNVINANSFSMTGGTIFVSSGNAGNIAASSQLNNMQIAASDLIIGNAVATTGALTFDNDNHTFTSVNTSNVNAVNILAGNLSLVSTTLANNGNNNAQFVMTGGALNVDGNSNVGPCSIAAISNAQISNDGNFSSYGPGSYTISNSSFGGSGNLWIGQSIEIDGSISQNNVYFGQAFVPGSSILNSPISGVINGEIDASAISVNRSTLTTTTGAYFNTPLFTNAGGTIVAPTFDFGASGLSGTGMNFSQGTFVNSRGGYLAPGAQLFTMSSGTITQDVSSYIGPVPVNLTGGCILNDGTITIGLFSTGSFTQGTSTINSTIQSPGNTGVFYVAQDINVSGYIQQNAINLGGGIGTDNLYHPFSVTMRLNGTCVGQIGVTDSTLTGTSGLALGTIYSDTGRVNADYIVFGSTTQNSGALSLSGPLYQSTGEFAFNALNLTMTGSQITSDLSSTIGPTPIQGFGSIQSDGSITIGLWLAGAFVNGTSNFSGNISGNGILYVASSGTFSGNISQRVIDFGQGISGSNTLVSGSCTLQIDGGLNGQVYNRMSSLILGSGSVTGPFLQNFGNINPVDLAFSNSYQTGALDIISMPVTSTGGTIGLNATSIQFFNGSLSQGSSSFLGFAADQFYMKQGQISSDTTSFIGPSVFNLSGGQIANDGVLIVGNFVNSNYIQSGTSQMQGVSIIGSGTTYVAGDLNILAPTILTQNTVLVAQGINGSLVEVDIPAKVSINTLITTSLVNGTFGMVYGTSGVVVGTTTNFGTISPTYMTIGTTSLIPLNLSFSGDDLFTNYGFVSPSQLAIINGTIEDKLNGNLGFQSNVINVFGGTISLDDASTFAQKAGTIQITGGYIDAIGNANSIGYIAQNLAISGGMINATTTTVIGPVPLVMTGGTIFNGGVTSLGLLQNGAVVSSKSRISGGDFLNIGTLTNGSDLSISVDCTLGNVINGQILVPSSGTAYCPGTISINASVTASIDNYNQGVIAGNNGFLSGTINNFGGGVNPVNLTFNNIPQQGYLTLNFLNFTNDFNGKVGWGSQNIKIVTGTILNENAVFGGNNTSQLITMSGGYLQNDGLISPSLGGAFLFTGGTLENTIYGQAGPIALTLNGGSLINNGTLTLTKVSTKRSVISSGSFTGSGNLVIQGLTEIDTDISQNLVIVQNTAAGTVQAVLANNGIINANVNVASRSLMYGSGAVNGDTLIQGELSVGPLYGTNGTMNFNGTVNLDGGSQTDFWIGPNYRISNLVVNGDLNVLNAPAVLFIEKQRRAQYVGEYTFPNVIQFTGGTTTINDFILKSYYQTYLIPSTSMANAYDLAVYFSSLKPGNYTGNAQVVAQDLEQQNGLGSLEMQEYIDVILRQDYQEQVQTLLQLCPQFKLLQYSLEKLMFTQEDYYSRKLYEFAKGFKPFFDLGFNQYAQKGYSTLEDGFNSYHINSWTENLGFTYGSDNASLLIGLGAIESYFTFLNYPARARYNTAIGELGYAGRYKRFEGSLDFLASYSAIKSRRDIATFDLVAKNSHKAWNASSTLEFGYKLPFHHFHFKAYDKVGYIIGKESHDKEYGAGVLNLDMQDEKLQMLRNTLGLNSDYTSKYFHSFFDLAYVYEAIFSPLRYKGSFVNTSGVMSFYAIPQNHNFFKVAGGFSVNKDHFSIDLTYQALLSKKFLEQSAALSFSRQF